MLLRFLPRQRVRCRNRFAAVAIFALLPLQFRYCLEARPYSEALFFSSLATLLFVRLVRREGDLRSAIAYSAAVAVGLYMQPFLIFTEIGHVVWLATLTRSRPIRRSLSLALCSLLIAGLLFLPWYVAARPHWEAIHTRLTPSIAADILHNLVGGGFLCSGIVIAAALVALTATERRDREWIMLLGAAISCGIAGPVLADVTQGYFFASRQLVFVLPALTVLTVLGFESLRLRRPIVASILGLLLVAGSLVADVRYIVWPSEDWGLAASHMVLQTDEGGCVVIIRRNPEEGSAPFSERFLDATDGERDSAAFYSFFEPSLRGRFCSSLDRVNRVIAVASPGTAASVEIAAQEWLHARGFRASRREETGGSRMTDWARK